MTKPRLLAHLCFFWSGFAALLYQVGWVKQLSLLMGNTAYTLTTILIAFMTGLALGSFLVRFTKASQFLAIPSYIFIEILIGVYGFFFLTIFHKTQHFYQKIFLNQEFSFWTEISYQFMLCGLLIFLPTLLMGATLPLLAEFLYRKQHRFTEDFGRLYAVNSYGAFFGTIFCGYIALPTLGYQKTVILAAGINFFVAFLAFLLQRSLTPKKSSPDPTKKEDTPEKIALKKEKNKELALESRKWERTPVSRVSPLLPFSMVAVLLFVSGFLGMSLQVAWNRLLAITLGGSTYTFTIIAACIILGIALGSHLITYLASKRRVTENDPIWLVLLASFVVYISSYGMTYLPLFIGQLNTTLNNAIGTGDIASNAVYYKFIISEICKFMAIMLILLPGTCLLGGIFPLTTALYSQEQDTVRKNVGLAYFINMLGVILGTGLAGYYFLPSSGFEKTIRFNLMVGCFASYILVHLSPAIPSKLYKWLYSFGILYALILTLWWTPLYNYHLLTSAYFYNRSRIPSENELRLEGAPSYSDYLRDKFGMIFLEEDAVGLITVHESRTSDARWFKVNGKVDGSTSDIRKGGDITDCQIIATAGFLFEPESKEVLTIGLGLGITHGTVLSFPVKRAVVVEISEAVTRLSREFFSDFNNAYWEKQDQLLTLPLPESDIHLLNQRQFPQWKEEDKKQFETKIPRLEGTTNTPRITVTQKNKEWVIHRSYFEKLIFKAESQEGEFDSSAEKILQIYQPKSQVIVQDGRQFLKVNSKQWDIIICEPSNPWMSGVSSLFTLEFYQSLQQRLKPEGIAVLWFHAYGLEESSIKSVLKSMISVFPNAVLLKGSEDSDIYFIARHGNKPLKISEAQLKTFYKEQYNEILSIYQADDIKNLLKRFVFKDSFQIQEFIKEAIPNTDDNMILEFSSGKYFNAKADVPDLGKRYQSKQNYQEFLK